MVKPQGVSKTKKVQPPIFSHQFVIENHGDIASCIVMVFIVGLMFPMTQALSAYFISPQYNGTHVDVVGPEGKTQEVHGYLAGLLDLPSIFFYSICWIVVHAVIQEYGLDKLQKRVHLSKISSFKFSESFHLVFFTAYSIGHALYAISERPVDFSDIKRIWTGYPMEHRVMSVAYKLFFIFQISYWVHQIPEFYLQKLKREEIRQKTFQTILHLIFISAAYFLNFTRVGIVLLVLEYVTQLVFHIARISHFLGKKTISAPAFKAFNIIFLLARLGSIGLAVLTFWYGLRQNESPFIDPVTGNYNTAVVRLNVLLAIVVLQIYQFYAFACFHFGRYRESSAKKDKKKAAVAAAASPKDKKKRNDSQSESDSKKKN